MSEFFDFMGSLWELLKTLFSNFENYISVFVSAVSDVLDFSFDFKNIVSDVFSVLPFGLGLLLSTLIIFFIISSLIKFLRG